MNLPGRKAGNVKAGLSRRGWMCAAGAAVGGAISPSLASGLTPGLPGPYRGRVVAVTHSAALSGTAVQASAVRQMFQMGMLRLTEARTIRDAWAQFIGPQDIVGIKFNSSHAGPLPMSSPEVFSEVLAGVTSVGVPLSNVVYFDRYLAYFQLLKMESWIPAGVRLSFASYVWDAIQQDMNGYDPNWFVDLPYVQEGQDFSDPASRRSYITRFATQDVTKIINLAVLKTHSVAGVTLALKNMSYGLANNVNRGHADSADPHLDVFIPAIASCEPIRSKVVLNIVDGIRGLYYGHSNHTYPQYMWDQKTMYFATDPVAVDRVCWKVMDAQRASVGWPPVDTPAPVEEQVTRQPSYILAAGAAGLGESDDSKINLRSYRYGLMR